MIVAVTGFMGSGKTTATQFFPKSWKRISADAHGHILLEEPHIIKRLTAGFGNEIVKKGKIDRLLLAKRAFSNKKSLLTLNKIMHPALRQQILADIKNVRIKKKHAVLDCALLQELRLEKLVDVTVLITAPASLCAKRATQWSKKEITERTQLQNTVQNPDFIIANTGSKSDLKKAVQKIVTIMEHSRH